MTSARPSPTSKRAGICTSTTSKRRGGRHGNQQIPGLSPREWGRVGIRNHVIILPLDDLSNAACEAVANNIKGTLAIPHPYGRLQFGADLELHFRTLIGTGCNPNVAAVIVIGIEPGWTGRVVDGIAATGKPVEGFAIERNGDHKTIEMASRKAKELVHWASEKQREEADISELWVSVKCGESDTTSGLASNPTVGNVIDKIDPLGAHTCFGETSEITGAEMVCAERGKTSEASEKFMKTFQAYMDEVIEPHKTSDLSDSQPTKGNIEGGLTTIEEKAFGNLEKIGKKTQYIDVLEPAGRRMRHPAGRGRFRGAFVPHRPGQCYRQSDRAGYQADRKSAHCTRNGGAYRCRRFRNSASRDVTGRRR
jgi:(2R)-sulfolactate sulfo-lyase subunit beta